MTKVDYSSIREMVNCELEKIGKKTELDKASLENLDKLIDIIKDIDAVEMNEQGYSQRMDGNSYGRYPYMPNMYYRDGGMDGSSYGYPYTIYIDEANSNRQYGEPMNYRTNRYSRDDGKERILSKLDHILDDASSEREREIIRNCISKLENM